MQTVPPPPALDPASAEPAEMAAANRRRAAEDGRAPCPRTARAAKAADRTDRTRGLGPTGGPGRTGGDRRARDT